VENFEVKQNSHVTFQFDLYHMPLFIFANHILLKHFSIYNYSQMIREGTFYKVIELLQNLDSRLKNLIPLASDDMVCDVGMSKPIPLDNMGDGFLKLFAFACLLNQKFPLVLIDEPENGLHYSAQKQFWGMLSDACLNNGKQSFIATHSYELLESLNTLLNENPDLTKPKEDGGQGLKVRVYELQRVGEHLQVVKIDQEVMSILIKHGSDFRG
jgi:predicted ATPase